MSAFISADRIRRTLKGKTVVRITSKTRNAAGYDVATPHGTYHFPTLKQAMVNLLTLARIEPKRTWTIKPAKKGANQ